MIKTNGFRVLAMVMTTLWMVTIIPVTVVQAADFRGQGFDLSSYNGTINWEQVAEADMDFVMIRTGEGRAPDVDTQFAANYDGAVSAGLKVGVYHVCCVRTPKEAVEEAEYCLETDSMMYLRIIGCSEAISLPQADALEYLVPFIR